jgi:hypothetical protein
VQPRFATPLLLLGLSLPFLGKPVHIDDTNFLALARGAATDPWRPHDVLVNWQGSTERAFDVLSNPPGIAWWLSPMLDAPILLLHLWMLPWLLLAAWGSWTLGRRFSTHPAGATLLICAAPIGLLATQAFTPDLPLLACTVAGLGGLTREEGRNLEHRWGWALLVGCAALFRYSGAALVPMVALWGLWKGGRRAALILGTTAAAPLLLLMVHDLLTYGQAHVLAMVEFQGTTAAGRDLARKLIASVAMLGGAAVLPIICWTRPRGAAMGLGMGLALGICGAQLSGLTEEAFWTTLIFAAAGGASLGGALIHRWENSETRWLACWALLGLVFLLALRFTAARYWIPFFPAVVLLGLQQAGPRLVQAASVLTVLLSLGLATDDHDLALVQRDLAQFVGQMDAEQGRFAGHWGWQYHLEGSGWQILEEDSPVPEGGLLAVSAISWPQAPAPGCYKLVECISAAPMPYLPRVHAPASGANLHAFLGAALPGTPESPCPSPTEPAWDLQPIESYAPWTFSQDPQEVLSVWRSCSSP